MAHTSIDCTALVRQHAKRAGYSVKGLFRVADVAYSNWWRWRNTDIRPSIRIMEKLLAVPRKSKGATTSTQTQAAAQ